MNDLANKVVSFRKNNYFESVDPRRIIRGVAGDFAELDCVRQIKLIQFTDEAFANRFVVGNHAHLGDSGQWEIIIVLGDSTRPKFNFRYRNHGGEVLAKDLSGGDVVLIPPGCSLALVALEPWAQLLEISNQEYNSRNYIVDILF
jgi:hypothetical protein